MVVVVAAGETQAGEEGEEKEEKEEVEVDAEGDGDGPRKTISLTVSSHTSTPLLRAIATCAATKRRGFT